MNKLKTPKEIATECKLSISNISKALIGLKEKDLIECVNPKDYISKFYQINEKGKKTLKELR